MTTRFGAPGSGDVSSAWPTATTVLSFTVRGQPRSDRNAGAWLLLAVEHDGSGRDPRQIPACLRFASSCSGEPGVLAVPQSLSL